MMLASVLKALFPVLFVPAVVWLAAGADAAAGEQKGGGAEGSGDAAPLAGLRKEHPRLLFTREDEVRVKKLAAENRLLAALIAENRKAAEALLEAEPVRHELKGPRLLTQSRQCIYATWTSAMAWRLGGDRRFLERAKKEMLTAAAFPDWNPSHFLDVAEMTAALAVGYDWLHGELSDEERARIRGAIVKLGLTPGRKAYDSRLFSRRTNNWNQVCNGGLVLGALAVAEDEPKLAAGIVAEAVESVPVAMASYRPDGAWFEGPAYWGYATSYNALMIAALESALGRDCGLARAAGFAKTGEFVIHGASPAGHYYSYADCRMLSPANPEPAMFWLARKFDRPDYAWHERATLERELEALKGVKAPFSRNRFRAMEIVWFDGRGSAPAPGERPLDRLFRGIADVVTMRSAWSEPGALWVGFKGGSAAQNHGHMDAGSFELESDGVRWAMDLGSDDYNLPAYFGAKRWNYFRLTNLSHNTLAIGGRLQEPAGLCRVTGFISEPARAAAAVDLTPAYKGQAARVARGVAMPDRSRVLVVDEIEGAKDEVRWAMATPAEVELDGVRATLRKDGKTLVAEILEPAGARFEVLSTDPGDAAQKDNKGTTLLAFRAAPPKKGVLRLAVLLSPKGAGWKEFPAPKVEPLAEWRFAGPKDGK